MFRGSMLRCGPLSLLHSRMIQTLDAAVCGSLRREAAAQQMTGRHQGRGPAMSCWDTSQRDGTTLGMAKGWGTGSCL